MIWIGGDNTKAGQQELFPCEPTFTLTLFSDFYLHAVHVVANKHEHEVWLSYLLCGLNWYYCD